MGQLKYFNLFRSRSSRAIAILLLAFIASTGCGKPTQQRDIVAEQTASPIPQTVVFHLPGISGEMSIDRTLRRGLINAGIAPSVQIVQWVGVRRGLPALGDIVENKRQAKQLAAQITDIYRQDPRTPIILTSHSGGTGVAVWALEDLPDDVRVDTLVMIASALSPGYDLSHALAHVRQAVSLNSVHDNLLLDVGTRTFGTIDRQKVSAAGYAGFVMPRTADASQYEKLTQHAYDPAWVQYGNYGDHVGPMTVPFTREVIARWIQNRTADSSHQIR